MPLIFSKESAHKSESAHKILFSGNSLLHGRICAVCVKFLFNLLYIFTCQFMCKWLRIHHLSISAISTMGIVYCATSYYTTFYILWCFSKTGHIASLYSMAKISFLVLLWVSTVNYYCYMIWLSLVD